MSPLRAGHCTRCGADVWRTAEHPRTRTTMLLWPDPTSRYAMYAVQGALAPGVALCATCPPPPSLDLGVTTGLLHALEPAAARYGAWYEPRYGRWLGAWIADELQQDVVTSPLWRQWHEDCRAIQGASREEGAHDAAAV